MFKQRSYGSAQILTLQFGLHKLNGRQVQVQDSCMQKLPCSKSCRVRYFALFALRQASHLLHSRDNCINKRVFFFRSHLPVTKFIPAAIIQGINNSSKDFLKTRSFDSKQSDCFQKSKQLFFFHAQPENVQMLVKPEKYIYLRFWMWKYINLNSGLINLRFIETEGLLQVSNTKTGFFFFPYTQKKKKTKDYVRNLSFLSYCLDQLRGNNHKDKSEVYQSLLIDFFKLKPTVSNTPTHTFQMLSNQSQLNEDIQNLIIKTVQSKDKNYLIEAELPKGTFGTQFEEFEKSRLQDFLFLVSGYSLNFFQGDSFEINFRFLLFTHEIITFFIYFTTPRILSQMIDKKNITQWNITFDFSQTLKRLFINLWFIQKNIENMNPLAKQVKKPQVLLQSKGWGEVSKYSQLAHKMKQLWLGMIHFLDSQSNQYILDESGNVRIDKSSNEFDSTLFFKSPGDFIPWIEFPFDEKLSSSSKSTLTESTVKENIFLNTQKNISNSISVLALATPTVKHKIFSSSVGTKRWHEGFLNPILKKCHKNSDENSDQELEWGHKVPWFVLMTVFGSIGYLVVGIKTFQQQQKYSQALSPTFSFINPLLSKSHSLSSFFSYRYPVSLQNSEISFNESFMHFLNSSNKDLFFTPTVLVVAKQEVNTTNQSTLLELETGNKLLHLQLFAAKTTNKSFDNIKKNNFLWNKLSSDLIGSFSNPPFVAETTNTNQKFTPLMNSLVCKNSNLLFYLSQKTVSNWYTKSWRDQQDSFFSAKVLDNKKTFSPLGEQSEKLLLFPKKLDLLFSHEPLCMQKQAIQTENNLPMLRKTSLFSTDLQCANSYLDSLKFEILKNFQTYQLSGEKSLPDTFNLPLFRLVLSYFVATDNNDQTKNLTSQKYLSTLSVGYLTDLNSQSIALIPKSTESSSLVEKEWDTCSESLKLKTAKTTFYALQKQFKAKAANNLPNYLPKGKSDQQGTIFLIKKVFPITYGERNPQNLSIWKMKHPILKGSSCKATQKDLFFTPTVLVGENNNAICSTEYNVGLDSSDDLPLGNTTIAKIKNQTKTKTTNQVLAFSEPNNEVVTTKTGESSDKVLIIEANKQKTNFMLRLKSKPYLGVYDGFPVDSLDITRSNHSKYSMKTSLFSDGFYQIIRNENTSPTVLQSKKSDLKVTSSLYSNQIHEFLQKNTRLNFLVSKIQQQFATIRSILTVYYDNDFLTFPKVTDSKKLNRILHNEKGSYGQEKQGEVVPTTTMLIRSTVLSDANAKTSIDPLDFDVPSLNRNKFSFKKKYTPILLFKKDRLYNKYKKQCFRKQKRFKIARKIFMKSRKLVPTVATIKSKRRLPFILRKSKQKLKTIKSLKKQFQTIQLKKSIAEAKGLKRVKLQKQKRERRKTKKKGRRTKKRSRQNLRPVWLILNLYEKFLKKRYACLSPSFLVQLKSDLSTAGLENKFDDKLLHSQLQLCKKVPLVEPASLKNLAKQLPAMNSAYQSHLVKNNFWQNTESEKKDLFIFLQEKIEKLLVKEQKYLDRNVGDDDDQEEKDIQYLIFGILSSLHSSITYLKFDLLNRLGNSLFFRHTQLRGSWSFDNLHLPVYSYIDQKEREESSIKPYIVHPFDVPDLIWGRERIRQNRKSFIVTKSVHFLNKKLSSFFNIGTFSRNHFVFSSFSPTQKLIHLNSSTSQQTSAKKPWYNQPFKNLSVDYRLLTENKEIKKRKIPTSVVLDLKTFKNKEEKMKNILTTTCKATHYKNKFFKKKTCKATVALQDVLLAEATKGKEASTRTKNQIIRRKNNLHRQNNKKDCSNIPSFLGGVFSQPTFFSSVVAEKSNLFCDWWKIENLNGIEKNNYIPTKFSSFQLTVNQLTDKRLWMSDQGFLTVLTLYIFSCMTTFIFHFCCVFFLFSIPQIRSVSRVGVVVFYRIFLSSLPFFFYILNLIFLSNQQKTARFQKAKISKPILKFKQFSCFATKGSRKIPLLNFPFSNIYSSSQTVGFLSRGNHRFKNIVDFLATLGFFKEKIKDSKELQTRTLVFYKKWIDFSKEKSRYKFNRLTNSVITYGERVLRELSVKSTYLKVKQLPAKVANDSKLQMSTQYWSNSAVSLNSLTQGSSADAMKFACFASHSSFWYYTNNPLQKIQKSGLTKPLDVLLRTSFVFSILILDFIAPFYRLYRKTSLRLFSVFDDFLKYFLDELQFFLLFLDSISEQSEISDFLLGDLIGYLFTLDWASDLLTYYPKSLDKKIRRSFVKQTRFLRLIGPLGFILEKKTLNLFETMYQLLYQPDSDLINRQQKVETWDFITKNILTKWEMETNQIYHRQQKLYKEETGNELLDSILLSELEKKEDLSKGWLPKGNKVTRNFEKDSSLTRTQEFFDGGDLMNNGSFKTFGPTDSLQEITTCQIKIPSVLNQCLQLLSPKKSLSIETIQVYRPILFGFIFSQTLLRFKSQNRFKHISQIDFINAFLENSTIQQITNNYQAKRWSANQLFTNQNFYQPDLFSIEGSTYSLGFRTPTSPHKNRMLLITEKQLDRITQQSSKNSIDSNSQYMANRFLAAQKVEIQPQTKRLIETLSLDYNILQLKLLPKHLQISSFDENIQISPHSYSKVAELIFNLYRGSFSKQPSKSVLIVGDKKTNKTLLIQAIAGETEYKLITETAKRYTYVASGFPFGVRLLKDVFASLVTETPCLFLLEDIHLIGQRRASFLSDDPLPDDPIFNDNRVRFYEDNQIYYFLSRYQFSKRMKLMSSSELLCKTYGDLQSKEKRSIHNHKKSLNSYSRDSILALQGGYPLTLDLYREDEELNPSGSKTSCLKATEAYDVAIPTATILELPKKIDLFPFGTSPLTILMLAKQKEFNPTKIIKELPWYGVPYDQLALREPFSYLIQRKVILLVRKALDNVYVKMFRIIDLLLIIDSLRSHTGFVLFATTHIPSTLDPALKRDGRFDHTITFSFGNNTQVQRWQNPRFLKHENLLASPTVKATNSFNSKDNNLQDLPLPFSFSGLQNTFFSQNVLKNTDKKMTYRPTLGSLLIHNNTSRSLLLFKNRWFGDLNQVKQKRASAEIHKKWPENDKIEFNNPTLAYFKIAQLLVSDVLQSKQSKQKPMVSQYRVPDINMQTTEVSLSNPLFLTQKALDQPPNSPISLLIFPSHRFESFKRAEKDSQRNVFLSIFQKMGLQDNKKRMSRLLRNSFTYGVAKQEVVRPYFDSPKPKFQAKTEFTKSMPIQNEMPETIRIRSVSRTRKTPSSTNWFFRKKILERHSMHLTNQWWNGQFAEYKNETTYGGFIEWRLQEFVFIKPDLIPLSSQIDKHNVLLKTNNKTNRHFNKSLVNQTSMPGFIGVLDFYDFFLERHITDPSLQDQIMDKEIIRFFIDFPDSEQFYNPKQRRWMINYGYWSFWFDLEMNFSSKPLGVRKIFQEPKLPVNLAMLSKVPSVVKATKGNIRHKKSDSVTPISIDNRLNKKREILDLLAYKLLSTGVLNEVDLVPSKVL